MDWLFYLILGLLGPLVWGWIVYRIFRKLGVLRQLPTSAQAETPGANDQDGWHYQI
jgi:hypothetical protein